MLAAAVLQAMLTPEGETTAPSLSAASWSNGDGDVPVARLTGLVSALRQTLAGASLGEGDGHASPLQAIELDG
jgi:hypothetical protein